MVLILDVGRRNIQKKSIDRGRYLHKFNKAALKYQITIDVHESKVVDIYGPCKGGKHDKTMFIDSGLRDKIPVQKKGVTDRVYGDKKNKKHNMKLCLPNPMDDKKTAKLKSRMQCRHETFDGRLTFFNALNATYRHSEESHQYVFESIAVMVQYQMDLGAPLFDA